MTGGGFGGSVVALVDGGAAASIGDEAVARYQSETGLTGNVLVVRPSAGTSVIVSGMSRVTTVVRDGVDPSTSGFSDRRSTD